jgi:CRP-like cAMP-binding protein
MPAAAALPLARLGFLRSLHPRDLARLEQLVPQIAVLPHQDLPAVLGKRDQLVIVREGRLALLAATSRGHRFMAALLERGSFFSTLGGLRPPEVLPLGDVVVSAIPETALRSLVVRYPQLGIDLAQSLTEGIVTLREAGAIVSQMHVDDRLWARVIDLAERIGVVTRDGVELRVGLTHAQWALLVGGSRESVTLAFGRFKAQGLMTTQHRMITIPHTVFDDCTADH